MNINLKKKVKESYEKIAQAFDESRTRPWENIVGIVERIGKHKLKIIDVGCGSGANAEYLYNIYREGYVGLDISLNMLRKLKQKLRNIDLICGEICNLPIRDEVAHIVTCIATIHHLSTREERTRAIGELCRISKRGSHILISVWRIESKEAIRRYIELSKQDVLVPWSWKLNERVERYYHLYSNNELLEETHICKVKYIHNIKVILRGIIRIGKYFNDVIMISRF